MLQCVKNLRKYPSIQKRDFKKNHFLFFSCSPSMFGLKNDIYSRILPHDINTLGLLHCGSLWVMNPHPASSTAASTNIRSSWSDTAVLCLWASRETWRERGRGHARVQLGYSRCWTSPSSRLAQWLTGVSCLAQNMTHDEQSEWLKTGSTPPNDDDGNDLDPFGPVEILTVWISNKYSHI